MVAISGDRMKRVSTEILKAAGCSDYEAELTSELLVLSNLKGHDSHGVGRIPAYVQNILSGGTKLGVEISVVRETPTTALINANWGLGQPAAKRSMSIAIEKALRNGVGIVSVYNCNHIGRLADYAEMALEHNMIGLVTANVGLGGLGRPVSETNSVVPYGGSKGILGTNPLCFAIPTGGDPVVLDMATSVWPIGKINVASARGTRVPEGILVDGHGRPSTDPKDLVGPPRGFLLPFGGMVAYKGYGLSLVIDILSGAISGSGCGLRSHSNGVLMMAFDVTCFRPIEEFKAEVDLVIKECRETPPYPGFVGPHGEKQVLVPGDPERLAEKKNRKDGIDLDETTWNQIASTAKKVGINIENVR